MTPLSKPVLPQHAAQTRVRIEKMTKIISALGYRAMSFDDICELIGYSPSGTRKYLANLAKANVVERASQHERVFKLTDDLAARQAFMDRLDLGTSVHPPKATKAVEAAAVRTTMANCGRHFHLMMDDAPFKIKPSKKIPEADPLLAMFYGRG